MPIVVMVQSANIISIDGCRYLKSITFTLTRNHLKEIYSYNSISVFPLNIELYRRTDSNEFYEKV